jgi:hypothetical protein
MTDKELAKLDPARVYKKPRLVLTDTTLTKADKIDILQRWGYDEREKSVAEEENMQSYHNQINFLDEISKCLLELGVDSTTGGHPPTKQG